MTEIYIKDSNKDILNKMQMAGFNVTTCGNCESIRLHLLDKDLEELNCESCELVSDLCDFPDLMIVQGR